MRGGRALLALSRFRHRTTCNAGNSAARAGARAERRRVSYRARVVVIVTAALALAPVGTSMAASGGAGIVPPQSPHGYDSEAVSYASFARTLKRGMVGQDVKTLQTWLTEVGDRVPANGRFGATTERMVRRFQAAHRLQASGIVGTKTAA